MNEDEYFVFLSCGGILQRSEFMVLGEEKKEAAAAAYEKHQTMNAIRIALAIQDTEGSYSTIDGGAMARKRLVHEENARLSREFNFVRGLNRTVSK